VNVPFKGGGESLDRRAVGFTPIAFIGGANFAPCARGQDGRARGRMSLAVVPGHADVCRDRLSRHVVGSYLSLVAPAGVPEDIVARVHREFPT